MKSFSLEPRTVLRLPNGRHFVDQRQGSRVVLRDGTKKQWPVERVEIDHTLLDIFPVSVNKEGDDEDLFA